MFKYFLSLMILFAAHGALAGDMTPGEEAIAHCWKIERDHAHVGDCAVKVDEKMKKRLADKYELFLAQIHRTTLELNDTGSHAYDELEANTGASQQAFYNYMDKECSRVAAEYGSGNGAGEGQISCEIDLIDQRIKNLNKSMIAHD